MLCSSLAWDCKEDVVIAGKTKITLPLKLGGKELTVNIWTLEKSTLERMDFDRFLAPNFLMQSTIVDEEDLDGGRGGLAQTGWLSSDDIGESRLTKDGVESGLST